MSVKSVCASVMAFGALLAMSSCSLINGLTGGTDDHPTGEVSESLNVDAFSLAVGDCLITSDSDEPVSDIPLVPCADAHNSEVIFIFDVAADGTYDQATIDAEGYAQCEAAAVDYVGPNYADLGLDWSYYFPTEGSWEGGDREIDCIVYSLSGANDLTSSVKGAGV